MYVLNSNEVMAVSGAGFIDDTLENMRIGGEIGAAIGFILTETTAGAARGGLTGAAAGFAWSCGWYAGTQIYEYFCM